MTSLDFLIVAAFIAYAVGSGLRNRRQASRNLDEYFLANRSLPGWQAGLSMAATQFAADTPLLVTGLIATAGIFALWQLWIYALAFLLMGFVLAPGWRRAGVLTDAELTEVRYGRRAATVLRGIKAVYFGTIFNCTVLAFVFFAAAKIAEPFLPWHAWLPDGVFLPVVDFVQWIGVPLTIGPPDDPEVWTHTAGNLISILLLLAVATFYSATGGLRSVVATDVLQLAIMLFGTAAFAAVVVSEVGGLGAVTERLQTVFAGGGPGGTRPEQILAFTPDHDAAHLDQRRLADQPAARGGDGRGAHPALDLVAHERLGGDRGDPRVHRRGAAADGHRRRRPARAPAVAGGGVRHGGGAGRHPGRGPGGPGQARRLLPQGPAGRLLGADRRRRRRGGR